MAKLPNKLPPEGAEDWNALLFLPRKGFCGGSLWFADWKAPLLLFKNGFCGVELFEGKREEEPALGALKREFDYGAALVLPPAKAGFEAALSENADLEALLLPKRDELVSLASFVSFFSFELLPNSPPLVGGFSPPKELFLRKPEFPALGLPKSV